MGLPKVLLVEDNEAELFAYTKYLTNVGYDVAAAGSISQAKKIIADTYFSAVLLDLKLPDGNGVDFISEIRTIMPSAAIVVATGIDDISTAVQATKLGADNYLTKPIHLPDLLVSLQKCLELEAMRRRDLVRQRLAHRENPFFGSSKTITDVLEQAQVAASQDTIVLLLGETGTGKGILAHWMHDYSSRKNEAFVELNCSGLKGEMLRSELYGHVKGSFTSSVKDRAGLIEAADKGTLFLDEIGDLDLDVQAQLLTTIEERSYRRLGENRVRTSDFRLVCATNRDLREAAAAGQFRKDLYYRICVFPIRIPPLRERTEDLLGLARHVASSYGYTQFPFSPDVGRILTSYPWPGNVRELRNMLERAVLLSKGDELSVHHFPGLVNQQPSEVTTVDGPMCDLEQAELSHIMRVLKHFDGDKRKASQTLGISLSSLYRKLARTGEVV